MKTKPVFLVLLLIYLFTGSVNGAFLRNIPQILEQPDGSILNCFATGDEFHNWLHDENNYTIVQDKQTGYYVYASLVNGELQASPWIAGIVNPAEKGIVPGLNISEEEYNFKKEKKTQFPGFKSFKATSNIGTMQNLVVFIRFQNQAEYNEYSSYYDNAFNGSNMVSMSSYYDVVSNNQLDINSSFFPESAGTTVVSFQDSHRRNYYQPYNSATNPDGYRTDNEYALREHTLLKDATEYVSAEIEGKNLNLDMDNDGNVDNIVYVIQGQTDGWNDLLWPHKWAMFSYNIYLNGSKIWWYNFQLSEAFNVSVLCHEMFHSLGAPDLYRYNDRSLTPVGPWDLMAETTTPPQHMSVFMKMKYGGWINSIPSITSGGTYTLESLANNPYAAFKIPSPNSSNEFFVLEYRNKTGQYESSLPGSGLIIYRVNPAINGNADGPPDEVYVYRPNGTTNNNGDIYSANFSQQTNQTRFDDNSNPSCFLSNGSSGGIKIQNIGSAGNTISFDVVMDGGFQPPRNLTASVSVKDVSLTWQKPLDGNGVLSGYKVFRNGIQITTINNINVNTYNDSDLADGNYNYYLTATYTSPAGESSQSNVANANIGTSGKPDLVISEAEVNPQTVDQGGVINVSCKLVNNGTGRAGQSILRLFLSQDQVFDQNDESIAYGTMDEIEPGNYLEITGDGLSIPAGISGGNWFVLFIADADNQVSESDEDNNMESKTIGIGTSGFEPPRNLTASASGNTVNLNWIEPLQGDGTLTGYKIYRNNALLVSLSDPLVKNYSDTDLGNGNYKYYVTALYASPTGESGPSNEASVSITMASKPDLIISNPAISSNQLEPGGNFSITCKYENIGQALAGESTLRLFFSSDQNLDGSDIHFAYGVLDPLDPGTFWDISGDDLNVPDGIDPGDWYVLYVADADENVDESNEDNNIGSVQVNVSSTEFNPPKNLNAYVYQNTTELFWEEPESGSAVLGGFNVYRNDQLIHTINNTSSLEYTDSGLALGYYTYYVTAFYSSPSGESIPSNLLGATITSNNRADLTIMNPAVNPAEVNPGDYVSISCYLMNNGAAQAGESILSLYFSRDNVVDNQDILLAYGEMGTLDAGYYFDISADDLLIPADLQQGIWQVLFVADDDKQVVESIETNNIGSFELIVGSAEFNPPRNLQAADFGRDVNLQWDQPLLGNGELIGYKMYRNGSFIALINDPQGLTYRDGSLEPGTYNYHVTAVYQNPEGESGPSNQASVNISSEIKPDLVILDPFVSPLIAEPGGFLDISCRLANIGTGDAANSTLLFFLSKDMNFDSEDIGLAYGSLDPVASGEYIDVTGSDLELPQEIDPGIWYAAFWADADQEVVELNENNNIEFVQIEIEISGFNPPKNLNASVSGTNVALNWQSPDPGTGTLDGFGIYRNGVKIEQLNNPLLSTYSDLGLDQGIFNYYVTAIYTSPSGESSSSNLVTVEITSSGDPDLIITEAAVSPLQIDPGGTVSVDCMLRNLGASSAGQSMMRLYISKDDKVDAQDEEIASGIMGTVEPGGFIEVSGDNLALPSSVTSGIWYILFMADADMQVIESDEQNNIAVIPVGVGESVFNPPENLMGVVSGNNIELYWNTPKPGLANLIGYNLYRNGEYYTSIDKSENQPFVDSELDYTSYSYLLTAVYENPVGESNPSNEVIITISADTKPDLIVRNASISPNYLDPGGVISIYCEILNVGNVQAGYSHLRLYLSNNEILDFSDRTLAYGSIEPIAPGSSMVITGEDIYIPDNLAPGEWFIFFVADADQEINESVEDNNASPVKIGVAVKRPDLVITSIYLPRNYANPGEMMRSTTFIFNSGLGVTPTTKMSFYLSEDGYLDDQDVYLNDIPVKRMAGKEQIFKNNYVTIPSNTIRKNYYLIAYIDVSQLVDETDEDNNTFAAPITVGSTGIDIDEINSHFSVYPSPASNFVYFKYDGLPLGKSEMMVFDQLGRLLVSKDMNIEGTWIEELDLSSWQKGFYYVKLISQDKQIVSTFIKL